MGCSCSPLHFPPPPFPLTTAAASTSPAANHLNRFPSLPSSFPFKPLQNSKNNYNNVIINNYNNNNNINTYKNNSNINEYNITDDNNNNNNNDSNNSKGSGRGGGNGGDFGGFFNFYGDNDDGDLFSIFNFLDKLSTKNRNLLLFLVSSAASYCCYCILGSLAKAKTAGFDGDEEGEVIFEIKGGKRIELVPDFEKDEFVVEKGLWQWLSSSKKGKLKVEDVIKECKELLMSFMLPEGYPGSVTSDYLEYSLWRAVQGVAAQINGVLATQALLYAVGLGKGAIPTAAAINWVLKDGIGYMSKIFLSKYGRHFDVNPKGWRLCADLLENAAYGLEILTPAFPHLFVTIGAVAGAGRSAAVLIQAATRSCFFAGFAAQRNFAEVIAKGEAQGMVSKFVGITLGISLASWIQSSTSLTLLSFGAVTWVHMFCNLKSYQSIQLRTLNPYRASLVFSEYLLSGLVPPVKEVNDMEPLLPALPVLDVKLSNRRPTEILSSEAKDAAIHIERRLKLGSKLSEVVRTREDILALSHLFKNEGYILTEHDGNYCVVLKESSLPHDMLKSMFHVSYLYWLEKNAGIKPSSIADDCRPGGRLQMSLEYVQSEFNHIKGDGELAGWTVDGLIARPLPNRIRLGIEMESSAAAGCCKWKSVS